MFFYTVTYQQCFIPVQCSGSAVHAILWKKHYLIELYLKRFYQLITVRNYVEMTDE
jgi:hypothetical protein